MKKVSIPDLLSVSRIPIAALIMMVYSKTNINQFVFSLALGFIALLTDFLDGTIARKLHIVSERGYILDGLGDRAVYTAFVLIFYLDGKISLFVAWLIVFSEISIYALRLICQSWREKNASLRKLSLGHALFMRIWIFASLLDDFVGLFDLHMRTVAWLPYVGNCSIITSLLFSYCILYDYFKSAFNPKG